MDIHSLFIHIANGEKEAFNALFKMWYAKLLIFAGHYLPQAEIAEEIVSDIFISLWQNRASLHTINNPESYLYVSTKNRCLNALRKPPVTKVSMDEQTHLEARFSESPHENVERQELYVKLNALVDALPEQRRIIFKMIKEDELTAKQTAEILNLSVRTVENQLYKAIKTLESEITAYLGYSPRKMKNSKLRNEIMNLLF